MFFKVHTMLNILIRASAKNDVSTIVFDANVLYKGLWIRAQYKKDFRDLLFQWLSGGAYRFEKIIPTSF